MPKKLTMEEVKFRLSEITKTIIIIDDIYNGNRKNMNCKCLICGNKWPAKWNNLSSNESGCPVCHLKSTLLTEDEIKKRIISEGYSLVQVKNSEEGSTKVRIKVICTYGHEYETSWNSFTNGRRCKKCQREVANNKTRRDIEEIKNEIYEACFEIIEPFNYKNNKSKFQLVCTEGHIWETNYNHFSNQRYCHECKNGNPSKFTYEYAKNYFLQHNCELLSISNLYTGRDCLLEYRCFCGNIDVTTFRLFKKSSKGGCSECSIYKKKYDIDVIRNMFNEAGYTILDKEYLPNSKINFICNNGHKTYIKLSSFNQGHKCRVCLIENRKGENHPNWNPLLTNEERVNKRKFNEYSQWRLEVFRRDHFTCQCCGDKSGHNLNAHHLNGWNWAIDERIDINNGITLCDTCHGDFHFMYGYGDNTREQYNEWLEEILQMSV